MCPADFGPGRYSYPTAFRFRALTSVLAQSKIHPHARLKIVASI
jgi:hypothetical protein